MKNLLPTEELPAGDPSELGFAPERLDRISNMIDAEVSAGRLPGAVTLVTYKQREGADTLCRG